jgi:hypothetical protein
LVKHISPRLLFALNKTNGLASETSVKTPFENIPRFVSCAIDLEYRIVHGNFKRFIFDTPVPEEKSVWHFALDGVAVEELYRPSLDDGCLRGLCPCAQLSGLCVEPKSMADLHLVQENLDSGDVHLSSEILVGAMIPNRRHNYGPIVVLAQGICKQTGSGFNKRILELIGRIWKSNPLGEVKGR